MLYDFGNTTADYRGNQSCTCDPIRVVIFQNADILLLSIISAYIVSFIYLLVAAYVLHNEFDLTSATECAVVAILLPSSILAMFVLKISCWLRSRRFVNLTFDITENGFNMSTETDEFRPNERDV